MIVVFFQDMPHYWYEKVTPVSRFIPTFGASSVSQISSLEKKITKEKRCKSKKIKNFASVVKSQMECLSVAFIDNLIIALRKESQTFWWYKSFFLCTLLSCTYIFFLHSLFYCQWDFIFYTKWVQTELGGGRP